MKKYESDRKEFDGQKALLASKHDNIQATLRDVQANMEAMKSQKLQLEREAEDVKRVLEQKFSEDAQLGRKFLEKQIEDLKSGLFEVQAELSRVRQSRDDVEMLGEHKFSTLERDYESLNEAKITIEKEMYMQQDVLRRATEARSVAEKERKEFQAELRNLREKFLQLQEGKLQAEITAEQNLSRMANERQAVLRKELQSKDQKLVDAENERDRLAAEVQGLTKMMAESDMFKVNHDQHKERLEENLS